MTPLRILVLVVAAVLVALMSLPAWVLLRGRLFKDMGLNEKIVWAFKMAFSWPIDHFFFVMGVNKGPFIRRFFYVVLIFICAGVALGIRHFKSLPGGLSDEPVVGANQMKMINPDVFNVDLSFSENEAVSSEFQNQVKLDAPNHPSKEERNLREMLASIRQEFKTNLMNPHSQNEKPKVTTPRLPRFEKTMFDDGTLKRIAVDDPETGLGSVRAFRADGSLLYMTFFKDGLEHGIRRTYSPENQLLSSVPMTNGAPVPFLNPWFDKTWWRDELIQMGKTEMERMKGVVSRVSSGFRS